MAPTTEPRDEAQSIPSLSARLHRRIGGAVCAARGGHRLMLAVVHQRGPRGEVHSERRPVCTVCWQMPGD